MTLKSKTTIKEIYKEYPMLKSLSVIDLIVLQKELRRFEEDKNMRFAVLELLGLKQKEQGLSKLKKENEVPNPPDNPDKIIKGI